ncbi:MAG TPA: hypothetical protein VMB19_04980 [Silvibacterium sp.]|nr:hypothetical protein [Silvibacterium sp.]
MKSTQWRYLTAMLLIGDGVVAFVRPRQDAAIWAVGPVKWKAFMGYLYDHPCLTRAIGAAEIGAGLALLMSDGEGRTAH